MIVSYQISVYYHNNNPSDQSSIFKQIIDKNPKLVFKEIKFGKYVIYKDPRMGIIKIYYLKGTGDIYFKLNNLVVTRKEKDPNTSKVKLYLSINTKDMLGVDVSVSRSERVPVYVNSIEKGFVTRVASNTKGAIDNAVYNTKKLIKQEGSWIGAILGTWIGYTSSNIFNINIIPGSGLIKSFIGGAAGGTAGYLLTKHFVEKMPEPEKVNNVKNDQNNTTFGTDEQIVDSAKDLVALELLGENGLQGNDLIGYYKNELRKTLKTIASTFGVEVEINYR